MFYTILILFFLWVYPRKKKERDMAKNKPYTLKYGNQEFSFREVTKYRKFDDMMSPRALEARTQRFRFYNKETIQELFIGLDMKRKRPAMF